MALGWVYVMSNESMPGLLKIGQSASDPEFRADELYTTGVPTPFRIEYKGLFEDYEALELGVHDVLSHLRCSAGREFFSTDVPFAVAAIQGLARSPAKFEWPEAAAESGANRMMTPEDYELMHIRSLEDLEQEEKSRRSTSLWERAADTAMRAEIAKLAVASPQRQRWTFPLGPVAQELFKTRNGRKVLLFAVALIVGIVGTILNAIFG